MPTDDYIKRSDAIEALCGQCRFYDSSNDCGVRPCFVATRKDQIKAIPAADVESKRRWISVTERLPEDDTIVLVVSLLYHKPYPAFQIGGVWYDSFLVACQAAIGMNDEDTIDNSGITHWTPLPEPPKEDEDAE